MIGIVEDQVIEFEGVNPHMPEDQEMILLQNQPVSLDPHPKRHKAPKCGRSEDSHPIVGFK